LYAAWALDNERREAVRTASKRAIETGLL